MKHTTQWLEYFAKEIKPMLYLEIGVNQAQTFNVIESDYSIGVDPNPDCERFIKRKNTTFYCMTSDEYFESEEAKKLIGKIDLIFIDGLHEADQTLLDFHHSVLMLSKCGWIILHDTWPPNMRHTKSDRCGDVYKITSVLRDYIKSNDGYEMLTLPWAYGLTVIRKGPPTNESVMGQG